MLQEENENTKRIKVKNGRSGGIMLEDLVDVLRVQRHDFLNHLQVISGFIQLKKYDRAGDYIKQVADELSRVGAIARLGCRSLAIEIFLAQLAASKRGIDLKCAVFSGVEKGLQNELVVVDLIRELLAAAVSLTDVSICDQQRIDFEISEGKGEYLFQVSFRYGENTDELAFTSSIAFIEEGAGKFRGKVYSTDSPDGTVVISLAVPIS